MNKYKQILFGMVLINCMQQVYPEVEQISWKKIQQRMPKKETIIKILGVAGALTTTLLAYYYGYFSYLTKMTIKKHITEDGTQDKKITDDKQKKRFVFFSASEKKDKKLSWSEWLARLMGLEPKASTKNDPLFVVDAAGKVRLPESEKVRIYVSHSCEQEHLAAFTQYVLQNTKRLQAGYCIESYTGKTIQESHWISNMADNSMHQTVTSDQIPFMTVLRDKTGKIEARFVILIDTHHQFAKIILSSINFTADRYENNKILFDFVRNILKYNFHIEILENDTRRVETEKDWANLGASGHFLKL